VKLNPVYIYATAEKLRSTLHYEIDVVGALEYSTQDVLCVMPQNDETKVSKVAQKLGIFINCFTGIF